MSRIAPAEPPYDEGTQAAFDQIMPAGMAPLMLFRVLARSPRIFAKFRAGALLDRGPLSLRQREIAIDRTCALNGCAYEWGVHVAVFAGRACLNAAEVATLAARSPGAHVWAADERAIIALCDDLHATSRISAQTWRTLSNNFDAAQILELIALAGFYRTVAYFANGLELPMEPFAEALPA